MENCNKLEQKSKKRLRITYRVILVVVLVLCLRSLITYEHNLLTYQILHLLPDKYYPELPNREKVALVTVQVEGRSEVDGKSCGFACQFTSADSIYISELHSSIKTDLSGEFQARGISSLPSYSVVMIGQFDNTLFSCAIMPNGTIICDDGSIMCDGSTYKLLNEFCSEAQANMSPHSIGSE